MCLDEPALCLAGACRVRSRRTGAGRLRECGELEDMDRQVKTWMLELYNAGNRDAARALCEAEKAQHASGCLHCRGAHRQGHSVLCDSTVCDWITCELRDLRALKAGSAAFDLAASL